MNYKKAKKNLQELTTTHAKQLARKGELVNNQTDCENRIKRLESFLNAMLRMSWYKFPKNLSK